MNVPTMGSTVNLSVRQPDIDATARRSILADDELTEYLIEHTYRRLVTSLTEEDQRYWCDRLVWWVKQRSPGRINQMERAKGLA